MRAASGSHQMLNSAAGVTLPTVQAAPPMTMQRLTFWTISGARLSASATLVSGASVTISMPGLAFIVSMMASTACCFPARDWRGIVHVAHAVPPMKPGRVLDLADERACRADVNRDAAAAHLRRVEGIARPLSTGTLPLTTVIASTSTSGQRSAMMRATASSEAVSVSISIARVTRLFSVQSIQVP